MAKKTMELYDNVVVFTMSIKGGELPEGFEVFIKVEMDFEGAKQGDLYLCCAAGSSARIQLQKQLREKTTRDLLKLADDGLQVKFNDIISGDITGPADRMLALTLPQFIVEAGKLGMEADEAEDIYNRKHEIQNPTE